jgi:hypothetical protein
MSAFRQFRTWNVSSEPSISLRELQPAKTLTLHFRGQGPILLTGLPKLLSDTDLSQKQCYKRSQSEGRIKCTTVKCLSDSKFNLECMIKTRKQAKVIGDETTITLEL